MSMTRRELEQWKEKGAATGRAYGEAGRNDRPYFGRGSDAINRETYWLEGFELGLKQRSQRP